MIKCTGCGRVYSDIVTICPVCETVLREEPGELPVYDQEAAAAALEITRKLEEQAAAEASQAVEGAAPRVYYCGGCGNPLRPGGKFCGSCGKAVVLRNS